MLIIPVLYLIICNTPRGGAAVVKGAPATFRVAGVRGDVVPVPNGHLHNVSRPCSALGFWIVAPPMHEI